ncbi:hypothetical protein [Candidatus Uabimicrobium sp. HlEnr_7]|uniref:hypothetical protein n=1 Tax=Candidatus Uabimicrobium helgolandensis TaxID=3095367 RepID=UPI003557A7F2
MENWRESGVVHLDDGHVRIGASLKKADVPPDGFVANTAGHAYIYDHMGLNKSNRVLAFTLKMNKKYKGSKFDIIYKSDSVNGEISFINQTCSA